MTTMWCGHKGSLMALALVMVGMTAPLPGMAVQAQAQQVQESTDTRLKRVEAELRALQRKVFPEGAGKTFVPEISAPATAAAPALVPATSAVTDLIARIDAIEAQVARLTAQSEENQNRMSKLEARLVALEPAPAAAAIVTVPATGAETPAVTGAASVPDKAANGATIASNTEKMTGGASKPPVAAKPAAKPAAPSADRVAAVQAIEKPVSGDRGEDEYLYGYRLWEGKFYPEAAQQLQKVVEQFPRHKRLSYARNLLGRSYLEDDKPGMAAQVFLQNYLGDKKGDRAPDSLLYLGVAMTRIKDIKRACGAFAELSDTYPTDVAGRLKTQYETATKAVKCN
jgi:TolA-binding protein